MAAAAGAPPRTPFDLGLGSPRRLRGGLAFLAGGIVLAVRHPGVLALLLLYSLLSALLVALPCFASALEHVAPVAGFAADGALDLRAGGPRWLFDEWAQRDPSLRRSVQEGLGPLLLLASLSGLLVCGGWMSFALRPRGEGGIGAFLQGGGRFFFRFLRTWLIGLLLFCAVSWLLWGSPGDAVAGLLLPEGRPELAASESAALRLENGRLLLHLALVYLVELVLDLARASLVAGDRSSGVLAILRGAGFLLLEPRRALGLSLAGLLLEAGWTAGCVTLVQGLRLPLWPLAVLLPSGRILLRGARYAGLAALYAAARTSRRARRAGPPPAFDDGTAWRAAAEAV